MIRYGNICVCRARAYMRWIFCRYFHIQKSQFVFFAARWVLPFESLGYLFSFDASTYSRIGERIVHDITSDSAMLLCRANALCTLLESDLNVHFLCFQIQQQLRKKQNPKTRWKQRQQSLFIFLIFIISLPFFSRSESEIDIFVCVSMFSTLKRNFYTKSIFTRVIL